MGRQAGKTADQEEAMNFEPQKFFIGLMDLFSILLPGALLTYLLMDKVGPVVLGDRFSKLAGPGAWAAFLFASYLFGHLVFLLGSWLDEFYDWARRYTLNTQIALLARRGHLLPWLVRASIWLVFKGERNLAVDPAVKIKQHALRSLQAKDSINTFQWCKTLLNAESPANLAVVQRFEADSKFFRCFSVVLVLVLVFWPLRPGWPRWGIAVVLVLLLLALWRYMEQRHKATNQAYWSVITLTAQGGKLWIGKPAPAAGSPTHAGGVVFRTRRGDIQYLLVEAKDDWDKWVLPKGHVEESEDYRETAVREVREETGVWAGIGVINPPPPKTPVGTQEQERARRRIAADLGNVSYPVNGTIVTVRFYLMQAVGRGLRKDKDRRHVWLPLKQARERASHDETRQLLQSAEERRAQM
jgi:ADP-ribose pyrophosphatase YjhB (NUDIX family)